MPTSETSTTPTTNANGGASGATPPPVTPGGGAGGDGKTSPATTQVTTTPKDDQGKQGPGTTVLGGNEEQDNTNPKADEGKDEGDAKEAKADDNAKTELELKLPDGFDGDSEAMQEFKGIAQELGLKSEGAQKLLDLYLKGSNAILENIRESHGQQVQQWLADSKADKEFGGANFETNVKVAMKGMAKYGDDELKAVLNSSGFGNHPAFLRAFYRAGKAISEDSVTGTQTTEGKPRMSEDARLRALYPKMFQQSAADE